MLFSIRLICWRTPRLMMCMSIVLEEVRNKNMAVYDRIKAICSNSMKNFFVFYNEYHKDTYVKEMSGETKNDRNDRAIRVAAQWYQNHLSVAVKVMFITNDKENKRKGTEEGIHTETGHHITLQSINQLIVSHNMFFSSGTTDLLNRFDNLFNHGRRRR